MDVKEIVWLVVLATVVLGAVQWIRAGVSRGPTFQATFVRSSGHEGRYKLTVHNPECDIYFIPMVRLLWPRDARFVVEREPGDQNPHFERSTVWSWADRGISRGDVRSFSVLLQFSTPPKHWLVALVSFSNFTTRSSRRWIVTTKLTAK
jgi:hypothetical protein